MLALSLLRRPAHRLAAVLVVALALMGSLLAQAMSAPRKATVQMLTMEVCSSSGFRRVPMEHKSERHDHEDCCSGAWLGLPLSVPVAGVARAPRHAVPAAAPQPPSAR